MRECVCARMVVVVCVDVLLPSCSCWCVGVGNPYAGVVFHHAGVFVSMRFLLLHAGVVEMCRSVFLLVR